MAQREADLEALTEFPQRVDESPLSTVSSYHVTVTAQNAQAFPQGPSKFGFTLPLQPFPISTQRSPSGQALSSTHGLQNMSHFVSVGLTAFCGGPDTCKDGACQGLCTSLWSLLGWELPWAPPQAHCFHEAS